MKKIFTYMLTLILVLALCSCSNEVPATQGDILEVDITEFEDEAEERERLFSPTETSLPYIYRTESLSRLGFNYNVPTDWSVTESSARHHVITSKSNDQFLPNASFNILFHIPGSSSTFLEEGSLMDAVTIFQYEITNLEYLTPYGTVYIDTYSSPTNVEENPSYSLKEGHVAKHITDKVSTATTKGEYVPYELSLVNIYFNWYGNYGLISTVVEPDLVDEAEDIMEYILSTSSYVETRIAELKTVNLSGMDVPVCTDFEAKGETSYMGSLTSDKAGMSISVYTTGKGDTLTADALINTYAPSIVKNVTGLDDKAITVTTLCYEEGLKSISGKEWNSFSGTFTLSYPLGKHGKLNYYSSPSFLNYKVYSLVGGDKVIAVLYQDGQEKMAEYLNSAIINSGKVVN